MRLASRLAPLAAALVLFTACSEDDPTPPQQTPTLTVSSATTTATVARGSSATYPITIVRGGGFTGQVALAAEGLPTGVTASFAPATLPNGTTTSVLTLTAGQTAAVTTTPSSITIRASGSGVTAATTTVTLGVTGGAGVSLGLTPATVSIAAGGTGTSNLALTRSGGFTGDVALTVTGAPTGLTVGFAPATVTGANTTSALTVTTTGAVAAGTYNLTITGTGANGVVGTSPLTVTVTAPQQSITAAASNVTVSQGATGTSNITLTRQGGFAGAVGLAVTGLPTGVTATFNPASVTGTGTTSALSLAVGSAVAPGTYTGTVTASGTGVTNATDTFTLTVTAATGGGNVVARFCDATTLPLWLAVRQGTTGAWTQVAAGANNTYNINVTGALGGIAFARPDEAGGVAVQVSYGTATELAAFAAQECVTSPVTKTVTATVTGLSAGQSADVSLGGGSGTVTFPNTTVQITGATEGSADLIAVRYTTNAATFTNTPDRIVIRRGINPAAGSTITPTIDFNGTESAAVGTATYTLANAGTPAFAILSNSFQSTNGAGATFTYGPLLGATTTRTVYGLPTSLTQAGDQHFVLAIVADDQTGQSVRLVGQTNRELINRTITLGAPLSAPTVSVVATTPYVRLRATGPIQAEYGDAVAATFTQASTPSRSWVIQATRAFIGTAATTYSLEMPDFTGVSGFQSTWGLRTGVETGWNVTAYSGLLAFAGGFTEGATFRGATRGGEITP